MNYISIKNIGTVKEIRKNNLVRWIQTERALALFSFKGCIRSDDGFQPFPVRKNASLNGLLSSFALSLIFVTFQEVLLLHQRAISLNF